MKVQQPTRDKPITFLKIELFDKLMHFMQMLFCFACFKMRMLFYTNSRVASTLRQVRQQEPSGKNLRFERKNIKTLLLRNIYMKINIMQFDVKVLNSCL